MMTVAVKIWPKKEVLDVQGRAIAETLKRKGYALKDCRYGKLILLNIKTEDAKTALKKAKEMTELVLCNKLIEDYELSVLPNPPS